MTRVRRVALALWIVATVGLSILYVVRPELKRFS